jgi:transcriptional regulator with XRE-family HTH domain
VFCFASVTETSAVPKLVAILGKRIASLRRRAGLTQEDLAEASLYSVDFIGLVERGINAPSVERLPDIADALGVQVWELFAPQDKMVSIPQAKKAGRSG